MIPGSSSNLSVGYLQNILGPKVVNIMFIAGLGIYTLFSVVILKQTRVMSETIDGKYNAGVRAFAWVNLLMAILLAATAIFFL